MTDISETVAIPPAATADSDRWLTGHGWLMLTWGLGMILEAYVYSLSSVATTWVSMPKALTSLLLAWSPLFLIVGIGVAGPVSDFVGRKATFFGTMALYVIGALILSFANTYYLILIALALLLAAAGGEMNTIMASAQELLPTRHRTRGFYTVINATNIGVLVLGVLAFSSLYHQVAFQRILFGVTIIVAVAAMLVARLHQPESVRWLARRRSVEAADRESRAFLGVAFVPAPALAPTSTEGRLTGAHLRNPPLWLKLLVVTVVAWTNTTGFGLLELVAGPYYFPKQIPTILTVAGIGAIVGGVLITIPGDAIGRRAALLFSDSGSFVLTLIILATISVWKVDIALFYVLLFLSSVIITINYLVEDTLKSELWPTMRRGTLTGLCRFLGIGLFIPVIFATSGFSLTAYMAFNASVWFCGTVAAVVWFIWGRESGKSAAIDVVGGDVVMA